MYIENDYHSLNAIIDSTRLVGGQGIARESEP